jgi:hypothetical protein
VLAEVPENGVEELTKNYSLDSMADLASSTGREGWK